MSRHPEQACQELTDSQRQRSMKFLIFTAVAAVTGGACVSGSILTLTALKLGANEMYIGALSFSTFAPWAFSLLSMSAVEKRGKKFVLIAGFTATLLLTCIYLLIPIHANSWPLYFSLTLLLVTSFARNITFGLGNAGWFPLIHDVVPRDITGKFFAKLRTSWQTSRLLLLLGMAWFLHEKYPAWWKFELIFAIGIIALSIRIIALTQVNELPWAAKNQNTTTVAKKLVLFFSNKNFRVFGFYVFSYMIAAMMAEPFKVKFLKDAGHSDGLVLAATSMVCVGAIVSLGFWGKLADKFGNRAIFTITHIGMALSSFMWVFAGPGKFGLAVAFLMYFSWSIFNSGNGIAQTRYMLHTISPDKQYAIIITRVITNMMMGVAPLMGGAFLLFSKNLNIKTDFVNISNYKILFTITALLFIIPHLLRKKLLASGESSTSKVLNSIAKRFTYYLPDYLRRR